MSTSCSVVIPTYNEAGNVAVLVARLCQVLAGEDTEIVSWTTPTTTPPT